MARLVVTLPPSVKGDAALELARAAKARGADLLEVRTDLHQERELDVKALSEVLGLVVSERGQPIPYEWVRRATFVDREVQGLLDLGEPLLASHHAQRPLSPAEALALWQAAPLPKGAHLKHVEPLGKLEEAFRLFETRDLLTGLAEPGAVTVLAMGPLALPFRCLLAQRNALDYVALGPAWVAAPGQRLLDDAVREKRARRRSRTRLAILGTQIPNSRSPRIHPQPFDRIDLPADAPVGPLVDVLRPYYSGFAVTSPFKKPLAAHFGAPLPAINTLFQRGGRWQVANTDLAGAKAVLERLRERQVVALGDGGATAALKAAAEQAGVQLTILKRDQIGAEPLSGAFVWTWPDRVEPPAALRFAKARVAVIAYGPPGRQIAQDIARRGGTPVRLGAAWFIAQARQQRRLWEED